MNTGKFELKLDAGFIPVPIVDENDGELLGKFKFNPSDLDIANRYSNVMKKLESVTLSEGSEEEIEAVSNTLKTELDYLLGCKVSDDIFAICNPLTPVSDGDFFVEKVLNGIAGLIEQVTNQRVEMKKAKIRRATAKYHE